MIYFKKENKFSLRISDTEDSLLEKRLILL
jgi:hypothetical protein